jgi:FkbM family methyltransferase
MSGLQNDDLPFHHYTLRHRITAWISQRLFDHVTYTVRHGLLRGMKRRGGLGWMPKSLTPGIDSREHQFLKSLDLRGLVVYDIGAFHGLLTMFFARQAKQVICYEPNKGNRARLIENVQLNSLQNVIVRPVGVGSVPQTATMNYRPLMPGSASLEKKIVAQLKAHSTTVSEEIQITTLDQDRSEAQLAAPDFMKIDIEGLEIEALRGARHTLLTRRPALFLEMHGETMKEKKRKVAEIVGFLTELGYSSIQHVETGTPTTKGNSFVAVEGHLYCTWQ